MSATSLATHVEKNLERSGTYTLYADSLHVLVSYPLRGTAETTVPLASLGGTRTLARVHSSLFNFGIWMLTAGAVALGGLHFVPALGQSLNFRSLVLTVIVFGVAIALLSSRRLVFITIPGRAGEVGVTIGIGPSGQAGLEAFVERVLAARASAGVPAA